MNEVKPTDPYYDSDYCILLYGLCEKYIINLYEKNCIIILMVQFINKYLKEEPNVPMENKEYLNYSSGLYRLHKIYQTIVEEEFNDFE